MQERDMAAKKSGTAKSTARKTSKQSKKTARRSVAEGHEPSGAGLSLSDQARLTGKYEKFESLDERVKEVERVKRFIFANLGRTALGMMKSAEKGTNAAGAKLLWEFAEIDKLPTASAGQAGPAAPSTVAGDAPAAASAVDDDPTKAVLSFYKKLGMTPPKLGPPKPVEAMEAEADLQPTM
jgi:hypothetical protein